MRRRYFAIVCFLLLAAQCGFGQSSFNIGWNIPTANANGTMIGIRGKHNGKDSAWIINTETAQVMQRIPEGSFGLEMKLIRAGVYPTGNATYVRQPTMGSTENKKKTFDVTYDVYYIDDSLLASSTVSNSKYNHDAMSYAIARPLTALIGRQEGKDFVLYDMTRKSGKYAARVFALDTKSEIPGFHMLRISPDGRYAFFCREYVMVDLQKGKMAWHVNEEERTNAKLVTFSATGDSIAFPLKSDSVFAVRDVRNDKTLYRISIANNPDAKALGMTLSEAYPLPDMKHILAWYRKPNDPLDTSIWCIFAADGSYRRINF